MIGDTVSEQEALWIEAARKGDDLAFGQLVEKYQKPVFSLCYRLLGNSNDAEDAAQEAFIRAYRHLKRYDPNRSFATWLLSIASHYCIDRMRKRQLPTVSTDNLPQDIIPDRNIPDPEREYRLQEREMLVQNLLNKLKPIDRAAIILRYWHQCSEVEIADSLNLSVSAVKSRLFRSRQTLAELWTSPDAEPIISERKPHESPAF
jgi:RNA polymerase sigma-70 factor (ECF subfamily)